MPVKLLVDRAGIVGDDGESHQGVFDAAYLSTIPNINIYSPCFFEELKQMILNTAKTKELSAIRYPRGCENNNYNGDLSGDYTVVSKNFQKVIVTYGRLFSNAVEAQKRNCDVDIVKLNKIYPISQDLIDILKNYNKIYFFEEGIRSGGIAEHIASRLLEQNYGGSYSIFAIDDEFVPASSISSALKKYKLDTESMIEIVSK